MKTSTIREALQRQASGISEEKHHIYLFRDMDTVFYVGQSHHTYNRFLAHMGLDGRNGPSMVGQLLIENVPESENWQFEEYTLEDCREIVMAYRQTLVTAKSGSG